MMIELNETMKKEIKRIVFPLLLATALLTPPQYAALSAAPAANEAIHHHLKISLEPAEGLIRAQDEITFPSQRGTDKIEFLLHGHLTVSAPANGVLEKIGSGTNFAGINSPRIKAGHDFPVLRYHFIPKKPTPGQPLKITLNYTGKIQHNIKPSAEEYARGFSETPGIISPEGVYLAGSTFWIPRFDDLTVSFSMTVETPANWTSVSQGDNIPTAVVPGKAIQHWRSLEPMEEIYLIAAPFTRYEKSAGKVSLLAFLRATDAPLAEKYLDTAAQYLDLYQKLIGPYPYSKFALVENFWETGYGMPSFTLLGAKIIRFPFILHSSYPHELLHNWWGNSVFSDYKTGNWCEGLTAYLADYLIKEQRRQGAEYRRDTLQNYTHHASGKPDEIPLTKFTARFNPLTSAVGYGKSMMMFHMLRQWLGDKVFIEGLRLFYKNFQFRKASFSDLAQSFSHVSGQDLSHFFNTWTTRSGAPELRIRDVSGVPSSEPRQPYTLTFTLEQLQPGEPFPLRVPAAIRLEGVKEAHMVILEISQKKQAFTLLLAGNPLSVQVDPEWDVLRILHESEVPPALSGAFGAEQIYLVTPSRAPKAMAQAYLNLAESWRQEYQGKMLIISDADLPQLPSNAAIWVLGAENKFIDEAKRELIKYGALPNKPNSENLTLDGETFLLRDKCLAAAVRQAKTSAPPLVWLSAPNPEALPGLGRKLPHYGKYSYLVFSGSEPENIVKGQWPTLNSPLEVRLTDKPLPDVIFPKRSPLADFPPLFQEKKMMAHISRLASEELEGRGIGSKGIEKAAHYIASAFKEAGLQPGGDNGSFFQSWEAETLVGKNISRILARNIIAVIPGTEKKYQGEQVIVCAHYDHLGLGWPSVRPGNEGRIHYGANDNASGVAVLLELARVLANESKPERTLVFIAFTGEESELTGSRHYVKQLEKLEPGTLKKIMAVVNLDTVGQLREGGKLLVFGGSSAREWRFMFMGISYTTGIDCQLVSQDVEAGDHIAFTEKGVPGVHLFSGIGPEYHTPADTVDVIYGPGLPKVAAVAREALVYLTGRPTPLTISIQEKTNTPPPPPGAPRSLRTGVMPDFSFDGSGVRVAEVAPGSPAEKAGLRKGDVIVALAGKPVTNLREYAIELKSRLPGDKFTLSLIREGQPLTAEVETTTR